jgi:hypothetical protein
MEPSVPDSAGDRSADDRWTSIFISGAGVPIVLGSDFGHRDDHGHNLAKSPCCTGPG